MDVIIGVKFDDNGKIYMSMGGGLKYKCTQRNIEMLHCKSLTFELSKHKL
jgi:hypothetical protein